MLPILVSVSLILFGLSLYLVYAIYQEAVKERAEVRITEPAPTPSQPPQPEDRSWEPTGKLFNCSTYANVDMSNPEVASLKAQVDRYVKTQEFLDLHPQLGIDFSPMPPSKERIDSMKVEVINSSKSGGLVGALIVDSNSVDTKKVSKVEEVFNKMKDADLQTSILATPALNGELRDKPKKPRAKKSKNDKTTKKPTKAKKA